MLDCGKKVNGETELPGCSNSSRLACLVDCDCLLWAAEVVGKNMSFCLNTDLQMCMPRSLDLIQFSITSLRVEPTSIEKPSALSSSVFPAILFPSEAMSR